MDSTSSTRNQPDDEAARIRNVFQELHARVENAQEFLHNASPQVVKEYVQGLQSLKLSLAEKNDVDSSRFESGLTELLNRQWNFEMLVGFWLISQDSELQEKISELALLLRHPTFTRHAEISHDDRVAVINSRSPEQSKELLEKRCKMLTPKRTAEPQDEAEHLLHVRFRTLHAHVEDAEDFLCDAKRQVVEKYLTELEILQNTLSIKTSSYTITNHDFKQGWAKLLNRKIKFEDLVKFWDIRQEKALQETISTLALVHRHPTRSKDVEIPHHNRVAIINSTSLQDAEALLKQLSQPETVQTAIVEDGYDQNYLNADGILDPTLALLKRYTSSWISNDYLAPYTALIGPSMSGKTRLLMELSKHTCVVYICIRPTTSTGHPPRSQYASSILLDPSNKNLENQYELFLLAILEAVADYFQDQTGEKEEILAKWIAHSFPKKGRSGDPPFWSEVKEKMNKFSRCSHSNSNMDYELPKVLTRVKESIVFLDKSTPRVLLAIDEARELLRRSESSDLSYFRIFRRVIKKMPAKGGFFSILADTTSRVSNFSPPEYHDPSHRPGKSTQAKLYPPIYKFPTFDVNVPTDLPATWQKLPSAFRLLRYGSPFWGAYVDSANEKGLDGYTVMKELTKFALEKLLCTTKPPTPPSLLTHPQAIALLGSTIQPQLYGAAPLNAELVSSHGAQCMYIHPLREMLISEYPSQFTFSSAANEYLAHDDARWIQCIQVLTFTHRQGYISSGDVGELVSRIILLRAMQETMIQKEKSENSSISTNSDPEKLSMPFGSPVPLLEFLMTLTGLPEKALIKKLTSITKENKDNLLRRGHIFWNHFVSIHHTPAPADLLRKLCRGMAVHCKPNQFGFDQLFTVYLQSDPTEPLHEDSITFCGVQVKNRKQNDQLEDDSHKWTPGFAGMKFKKLHPYLVLYFSLRDSRPQPKGRTYSRPARSSTASSRTIPPKIIEIPNGSLPVEESQRRASLAFYGLKAFPFLSPEFITALEELLDAHPNILLLHEEFEDDKIYVESVSPEVYSKVSKSSNKKKRK